jgi:hypothetical protein
MVPRKTACTTKSARRTDRSAEGVGEAREATGSGQRQHNRRHVPSPTVTMSLPEDA